MGVSGGGPSSMYFAAKIPTERTFGLILFEAVSLSQDFMPEDEQLIKSWDYKLLCNFGFLTSFGDSRLAGNHAPEQKKQVKVTT